MLCCSHLFDNTAPWSVRRAFNSGSWWPCCPRRRGAATKGDVGTVNIRSASGPGRPRADAANVANVANVANTDAIMSERRRLVNVAYRLLGSPTEAEDVVQETYSRWYALSRREREAIETPAAWLTTVAGRICLNLLGSARARRELPVGQWVPEPRPEQTGWTSARSGAATADPAEHAALNESVGQALSVLLGSMTPAERVTFVLHDVFCHTFAEVAELVGRTPAACRQLASSARRRVRSARPSTTAPARCPDTAGDFRQAWEAGDIDTLVDLLRTPMDPLTGSKASSGEPPILTVTHAPDKGIRRIDLTSRRN